MNYRHAYHAGGFADVMKHVVLTALIASLSKKEAPFCYLETHAGAGCYDLLSNAADKNKEYLHGISKVVAAPSPPTLIKTYLDQIKLLNTQRGQSTLRYYPGSPAFAHLLCRESDKLILCELHQEECQTLRQQFNGEKQIAIHCRDGYEGLKAFLPPKEKRGLIFIDPPFEQAEELTRLSQAITEALIRFASGTYAIWYPLKDSMSITRFKYLLKEKIPHPILSIELSVYTDDIANRLYGSGMLIINPPWQLEAELSKPLGWLWNVLKFGEQGKYHISLLK